jgi:ABC-type sulfate transport system substrate-binding protein
MTTLTAIDTAALDATLAGATVAPGQKPVRLLNGSYDPTRELWRDDNDNFIRRSGKEADLSGKEADDAAD